MSIFKNFQKYFNLDGAKAEVEDWVNARKEVADAYL